MVQNGIGNPKFDKLLLRARCTLLLSVLVVPSCLTNFKWGGLKLQKTKLAYLPGLCMSGISASQPRVKKIRQQLRRLKPPAAAGIRI